MANGWQELPLKEVAKPIVRPVPVVAGTSYRTLGVKWWGMGAYERQTIDGSRTAAKSLSIVREGDLIINKIWVRHGSVAIATKDVDGCAGSGEFPAFALDLSRIDPRWIHWQTKMKSFWEKCDSLSRGTSGKNRIKPELFLTIKIPLPSLAEQRRILARVEDLARRVEEARGLREGAVEETEALVSSFANEIFGHNLRHKWPSYAIEDIAEIRSGVTLGRVLDGSTVRLPYLRVANVQDGHLDFREIKEIEILESEKDKWQLAYGDILLTEGGDWDKLGRGTVWRDEIPGCIHQNHIFRLRVDQSEFDPFFVSKLFSSPYGKAYFQSASKQTTNLASINQRQLKVFQVIKPPLAEQRRIVAYLDGLQAKADELKRLQAESQKELDALMRSVLAKAFAGEL